MYLSYNTRKNAWPQANCPPQSKKKKEKSIRSDLVLTTPHPDESSHCPPCLPTFLETPNEPLFTLPYLTLHNSFHSFFLVRRTFTYTYLPDEGSAAEAMQWWFGMDELIIGLAVCIPVYCNLYTRYETEIQDAK